MNVFVRLKKRLSSLPGRILVFSLVSASFVLIALLIIFYGVRSLSAQFNESEQARISMEALRISAQQIEQSRTSLMEIYATSVRGDLQQLLYARNRYNESIPKLIAQIGSAGVIKDLSELEDLPERVLDASEALLKKDAPASRVIMSEVDATMQRMFFELDMLYGIQQQEATAARERAIDGLQRVSWVIALLLFSSVSATLLLTVGIERLVLRPLGQILKSINSIVQGERWELFPTSTSEDEISRIHQAMNALHARDLERTESVRQLEFQARYDPLTELPNRMLLAERLQQALTESKTSGKFVAVVFIDLDDFKAINDDFGHEFGDVVLSTLSKKMLASLREGDTLARLGGDEFVAILSNLQDKTDSQVLIKQLLASINEAFLCNQRVVQVNASAGISIYPQNSDIDPDQLVRQADSAMHRAKQTGRNNFTFFDASQDQLLRQQHEIITELQRALKDHELRLFYQPKVDLLSGELVGVEALLRWQHPLKGLLAPNAFLPIVEKHIIGIDIGKWVLQKAIADCNQWRLEGKRIPVAINLFPLQLQEENFVEYLTKLLNACERLGPEDIELEIVETAALEDIDKASKVISTCKTEGINFALDDFGTGYSSLTYLRKLPVKILKLDQSFVRGMLDEKEDVAIILGVLTMAKALELEVVAEGVETLEHGEQLLRMGCRLAQGYAIAKPMPEEQLLAWSDSWTLPERWRAIDLS